MDPLLDYDVDSDEEWEEVIISFFLKKNSAIDGSLNDGLDTGGAW